LTEPHSLAVLRVLRRCLRSGLRLASSPASNQPCSQPSWTRFSSSHRLPAPAALPPVRLAPRLRPCLRSASRPTLGNLPTTLVARSCPPALPPTQLAPRLRPCLGLVSSSRLLQLIRPELATSHRLSILWPPSCLGSGLHPSARAFRPSPFPWPFGLTPQ